MGRQKHAILVRTTGLYSGPGSTQTSETNKNSALARDDRELQREPTAVSTLYN